jgi:hypothetical protein
MPAGFDGGPGLSLSRVGSAKWSANDFATAGWSSCEGFIGREDTKVLIYREATLDMHVPPLALAAAGNPTIVRD